MNYDEIINNLNSIFLYKGDIHDLDSFFLNHKEIVNEYVKDFNNKMKLKKIINFNSEFTNSYFAIINEKIMNNLISINDLEKHPLYENILNFLSPDSLKKLYGKKSYEFIKRYGFKIILSNEYKYIESLDDETLNKFFDVFSLKKPKILNLINFYNALIDYNFIYITRNDLLNNHAFDKVLSDKKLYVEIDNYLDDNIKKNIFLKYNIEYTNLQELFNIYFNLYKSNDYKTFSKYTSLIKELCYVSYNKKREIFKNKKMNFSNGFPFKIEVSYNMKKIINKKKQMKNMCYKIAYNQDSLNELKKYLVSKNIVDKDFDTNILFALLTDGVKGVKFIEFNNINYLMGKILSYVSSFITSNLDDDIIVDDYKNLPLNDECFNIPFDKKDLINIINSLDLKKVFDGCIKKNYDLFYDIMYKHDLLFLTTSLKLTDVCFSGDCTYSDVNLCALINNFDIINKNVNKNFYSMFLDYLKQSKSLNNPYSKYTRVFGDTIYWIISDPYPLKSEGKVDDRVKRCLDIYKKMLIRMYVSVPILTINYDDLVISNNNFYDPEMLVTGEKLGSCMRAYGNMDDLFEYTLVNPNGFNIVIKKNNDLVTRIAGVCLGDSVFLNELRDPIYKEYSDEYLYKAVKKYVLLLVKKSYNTGQNIKQVFMSTGKYARNIKCDIVKNDMFFDLKYGKYGIKMNYDGKAICLYGDGVNPIDLNNFYYKIPPFDTLYDKSAISRINMLNGLLDIDSNIIDNVDYAMCSSNWYIYYNNGSLKSAILDGGNENEYQNAKEIINIKKNI